MPLVFVDQLVRQASQKVALPLWAGQFCV